MRIIFTSLLLSFGLLVSAQDTSIQKKDLISASKLFDLSFTSKEIDTLYSDVVDNLANYKAMHNLPLANSCLLYTSPSPRDS